MNGILWRFWRKQLFRRDAESVHRDMLRMVAFLARTAPGALRLISGEWGGQYRIPSEPKAVPQVFGLEFLSKVGLAAGFDKNAEILEALPLLGFGFAEIGTVTPRPQAGNDRPRLFRDVEAQSIFNRMGFNNDGAEAVARRLARARSKLPERFRVGVNIGKNRDTPVDAAAEDYAKAARPFRDLADFFVVNVSSPNTPGLRSLQAEEAVTKILEAVLGTLANAHGARPVLVKLAPELSGEELRRTIEAGDAIGASGWVLTNTLAGPGPNMEVTGGWSGAKLGQFSRARLIEARSLTKKPIISVGGISSAEEGLARVQLGAQLIELYSGWIFEGPGLPRRLSRALENK